MSELPEGAKSVIDALAGFGTTWFFVSKFIEANTRLINETREIRLSVEKQLERCETHSTQLMMYLQNQKKD